jgi:hypothetical protein
MNFELWADVAIKVRVDPIDRDIQVLLDETLSPQARSKMVADLARQQLAEAEEINRAALGRVPQHETFVDRRATEDLESVNPDHGEIVFEFDILLDLFSWIAGELEKHSPVGQGPDARPGHPGLYKASHAFFVDGELIAPGENVPDDFSEAAFVNVQPYSRKIERGLSRQAPDGVYQVVATLAQRRFGNVARIRFSYRVPLGGAINEWAQTTKLVRKGRAMKPADRAEWLRRQPAIVITVRS